MADQERNDVLLTDEVRELVALIKETDIAEVLIERGDAKLHIKRAVPQPTIVSAAMPGYTVSAPVPGYTVSAPVPVPTMPAAAAASTAEEPEAVKGRTITAPMVGTFYASPSPTEPPYVQTGDEIKPGDVVGIIEAMKIMNEIECELHGRVIRVLVDNGQAVEYGQALMVVEPL